MFKSTFIKSFDVDGQSVDVVFKRMSRKHAIQAAPLIESGGEGIGVEKSLEFMDISASILKECIVSISGLKRETSEGIEEYAANNSDFEEDVLNGSYFMSFVSEMISALMEESFMKDEEEKKSDQAPQGPITE